MCYIQFMRTTIDIPDETYRDLKIKAAREGKPVRQIVMRGIQRELAGAEEKPVRKLQLPLIRSTRPGTLELTNEQIDELTAFS
jgi:plasmid stability protein